MKAPLPLILTAFVAFIVIFVVFMASGEGGVKRMITLGGIYSVADPDGYPVVCFVDKQGGGMDCVPRSAWGLK